MSKNTKENRTNPAVNPNEAPEMEQGTQVPENGSESQDSGIDPNEAPETEQGTQVPEEGSESQSEDGKYVKRTPAFLGPYRKAYPKCRVFHVTSDRMVFLDGNLNMAKVHQRSIGDGEVETYKIK